MEFFLLFISFIIHILTFVFIRHLKSKLDQSAEIHHEIKEQKKEIEDLLAVYLLEIREENDKMIDYIKSNQGQIKQKQIDIGNKGKKSNRQTVESNQKTEDYHPPYVNNKEDILEQSFAAQVLSLYNQGQSIESIARQLDRGKTEIELVVKFQQKNK